MCRAGRNKHGCCMGASWREIEVAGVRSSEGDGRVGGLEVKVRGGRSWGDRVCDVDQWKFLSLESQQACVSNLGYLKQSLR